jgi:hypothetical protein
VIDASQIASFNRDGNVHIYSDAAVSQCDRTSYGSISVRYEGKKHQYGSFYPLRCPFENNLYLLWFVPSIPQLKHPAIYICFALSAAIFFIWTNINLASTVEGDTLFNSYIQRYKNNHLQMCFNLSKSDTGILVVCTSGQLSETNELIVGFFYVDWRMSRVFN